MPYPAFYHPTKVGQLYTPDTTAAVQAGTALNIANADTDTKKTVLLLIDEQVDFIHEDGALSVPGAVDDTKRIIEWIFDNVGDITRIIASLDSHVPIQIFSPAWWVDRNGQPPSPFTLIPSEDVASGKWQPLYEMEWSKEYVKRLEEDAKKQLMIWSYHTLIGTPGHSITPALYEAITYHAAARQTQAQLVIKGKIPKTEHYSIFEPEVKPDELEHGGINTQLLEQIAGYDTIYVTGQAKSHCVLESVTSMMRYFADRPEVIDKIHVIQDAMSSVVSPDVDFDSLADNAYAEFVKRGLHMTSTK